MDSVLIGWSSDDSVGGSLNIPSGFEEKAKRGQQPPTFADGDWDDKFKKLFALSDGGFQTKESR